MNHKIFTERLNSVMNDRNLKQVDFLRAAETAGIKLGKSQMSQYVSGKAIPRKNIALFLSQVLEVDVEWLYGNSAIETGKAGQSTVEQGSGKMAEYQNIEGGAAMKVIKKS